jgi:arabinogalactan oligomer/maltooligosaccharide transport system permease protein
MSLVGLGAVLWVLMPLREASVRATVWRHRWDYTWILPAGVAMTALVLVPFVTGASVSLFAHYRGEWTFVGFRHFLDIVLSRDWSVTSPLSFAFTLMVTVAWTVTNLFLHVAIGVALALVLREPWIRLRGVWRALLIIPWAVPNYITALIWKGMFHAQYGAINALIGLVALQDGPVEIDWFGSFASAFCANLTTNTWLGFPFMMVVTLGALQSIPRELEEAAVVDGAGWWFRFRNVVWPLLQPALLPAIILGSVWTFNMFNVIYLVSAGEPNSSTEILVSEAYRWAFSRGNRYGYAAAYAVLIFFVLLIYSRGANKLAGRRVL